MKGREWAVVLGVALLAVAGWLWRTGSAQRRESQDAGLVRKQLTPPAPPPLTKERRTELLREMPEAHLADELNAPGGTLGKDMAILSSLFAAYRSIYRTQGNPVGDNRDLVETFLGKNPNGIILLQAGHRAIDREGRLCDRWGTPLRFHAESGTRMEIRSAGPDSQWWTVDDVVCVP